MKKIVLWLLAFILTGILLLFGVSFTGRRVIAPAMAENGVQVSDTVLREEKELVRQRVTALAELYGFTAEPVIGFVDEETLRDLNLQASLWYNSILTGGKPGAELYWNTDGLEQILSADPALAELDREEAESLAATCTEEVRRSVLRMVLPLRQQVMGIGLQEAGKRFDIPNLVEFFLGLPWAALAAAFLLAGLIVLLAGKACNALTYIGAALGAAALVLAALAVLFLSAGILPMIREASASLTVQYQDTVSGAVLLTAAVAALMMAGCILCLIRYRKNGETV